MTLDLSPRLRAVAERIPPGSRLADVGTDHAYLPAWLMTEGRIPSAIATDLREGPLANARETVERCGAADRIALRLGDGLACIRPEEVDAVAIAGMGGETILEILSRAPWALGKTCVVQPMTSAELLRAGIAGLGAHIGAETLVAEGKMLYAVLTLEPGPGRPLTAGECWVGQTELLKDDPLWPRYVSRVRRRAEGELAGLRQSNRPEDGPRLKLLEEVAGWIASLPVTE